MKITAPITCIETKNGVEFRKERDWDGESTCRKYQRLQPSDVLLQLDYVHDEFTMEFTGKILGDSYPSLINRDTFSDCLNKIEDIGGISLNREAFMKCGQVIKCDVTCDVCYSEVDNLIKFLKANLTDYDKWATSKYSNGIELHKKVTTKRLKKRLIVYNKEKEIQMANNGEFLCSLKDKDALLSFFKGKVRFERNLNTKYSIRDALNINGNSISEVLNSTANPLVEILRESVKPLVTTGHIPSLKKDLETSLILKACNNDLTKLEATYRGVKDGNMRMSRIMPRFQEYVNRTEGLASSFDFNKVIDLVS